MPAAPSKNLAAEPSMVANPTRARVHRNHGRPRPNGFTGRAQRSPPPFTLYRERASGKALAFVGTYLVRLSTSGLLARNDFLLVRNPVKTP